MIAFQFSLQYDSIFRQQVMGDANYENTKQALCSHMMILGTETYFSFFFVGVGRGVRWRCNFRKRSLIQVCEKIQRPEHWPIPLYQTPSKK